MAVRKFSEMKKGDTGKVLRISVVSGCFPGPLLIDVNGSRVGLGFGTARKILVKEEKNDKKTDQSCTGR